MTAAPFAAADAVLAFLMVAALYTDLTTQRIPNALTFGTMALGLAISATTVTWWWGFAGMFLAFALMFPGYAFAGAVRAGDGKLLMAVGALLGWQDALEACALTYVLNLPFGLAVLAYKGRLKNLPKVLKAKLAKSRDDSLPEPEVTVVAFAPVIVVATIIARLMEFF